MLNRLSTVGQPRVSLWFRRHKITWSAIGVSFLLFQPAAILAEKTDVENSVKAAHLFRFAQFVEWPASAFTNATAPIVIGIMGQDYLSHETEQAVAGQNVSGRSVVVKRCFTIDEAERCHILFVSRSETKAVEKILAALNGKSILTVSDLERFSTLGGMIRLIGEGNRIRFRINTVAAEKSGLIISSKLLRIAERVNRGKD
jgi:hypothetical protein